MTNRIDQEGLRPPPERVLDQGVGYVPRDASPSSRVVRRSREGYPTRPPLLVRQHPIRGCLVERRYKTCCGSDFEVALCASTTSNGKPVVHRTVRRWNLELVETKIRRRFIPYFCSSRTIHSVEPVHQWSSCTTLVLFGTSRRVPKVYLADRAFSKMVSRQEDQARLDAGQVTTEELQRENSFFRGLKFRLTGIGGKKL